MKVAILGAGCYRTHAAAGITNFARACAVAEQVGKPEISMAHSTMIMGAELKELAGIMILLYQTHIRWSIHSYR
jgi:5,10-methenyltetrahydromethanopterin hydrogenase